MKYLTFCLHQERNMQKPDTFTKIYQKVLDNDGKDNDNDNDDDDHHRKILICQFFYAFISFSLIPSFIHHCSLSDKFAYIIHFPQNVKEAAGKRKLQKGICTYLSII